jgi:UDP-glucose 4-epimerase
LQKKILITGAAGGIGAPLVSFLKSDQLVLVDNFSGGSKENLKRLGIKLPIVECDLTNELEVHKIFEMERPTHVIHLAATTSLPECQANPPRAILNNVLATSILLENCRIFGSKFIFASTSAIYENSVSEPFEETEQVRPHLIYPLTKSMAENLCQSYATDYDLKVVILRLFNVIGPYQNFFRTSPPLVNYLVYKYLTNSVPVLHSTGTQKRDYVSVFEVCASFKAALDIAEGHQVAKIINISSNSKISVNQIDQIIRDTIGTDLKPSYVEPSAFWNSYPSLFEGRNPIKGSVIANEVCKESLGSNLNAHETLGVRFRPIDVWLPEIVNQITSDFKNGNLRV